MPAAFAPALLRRLPLAPCINLPNYGKKPFAAPIFTNAPGFNA